MIASVKEIDALNITLFNSCINFTNVHICNYCTKIFVIIVNTCVCKRSVDNKALILILILIQEKEEEEEEGQDRQEEAALQEGSASVPGQIARHGQAREDRQLGHDLAPIGASLSPGRSHLKGLAQTLQFA